MKSRTAVFLVAALVACMAYVAIERLLPKHKPRETEQRDVFEGEAGKAVGLTITADDGTVLEFETDGDKWSIVRPIRSRAVSREVNDLADRLKDLKYEQSYAPKDADAPGDKLTGLDKPRWTVRVAYDKGEARTLEVGAPVPLTGGAKTYVRAAGKDGAYVVDVDFAEKLSKPPGDYRDKTVWELDKDRIVRIEVEGTQSWKLQRDEDKNWDIIDKVRARADSDEVKKVLDQLDSIDAKEFIADSPEDLSPFGLADGRERLVLRAWVEPKAPPTTQPTTRPTTRPATEPATRPATVAHALLFGAKSGDDKVFARLGGEPAVFLLDADLLKDLQPKAADLRDKTVMPKWTKDAVSIDLRVEGKTCRLQKSGDEWKMTAPVAVKAGREQVEDLLSKLADLKATKFRDEKVPPGTFGLDKPRAVIRLQPKDKGNMVVLKIGGTSPSGEMTFLASSAADSVAVVPNSDLEALTGDPAAYHDPSLLKLPADAKIIRLSIKRDGETFELARNDKDEWRLSKPLEADAETDNVNTLMDRLEELKATRIVAAARKKVTGYYAKAPEHVTVRFTVQLPVPATQPASQPATAPATKPATRPATIPATQPATKPAPKPVEKLYTFHLVKMEDKVYGWIEGDPMYRVGRFADKLLKELNAELRDRNVLAVDADTITRVKITADNKTLLLRKQDDAWTYATDPDVPIDAGKVSDFLKEFKELKAEKFVSHKKTDWGKYGLGKPWVTVELTSAEGETTRISVAPEGLDKTKNRYAMVTGTQGVFTISSETAGKFAKKLEDFRK